jgi:hypothetical protein
MTFIVIPHEIGTATATLWIGAKGEGDVQHKPVRLDLNGESRQMGDNWRVWQTFADTDPQDFAPADRRLHESISKDEPIRERIYYQRLELEGLDADEPYRATLIVDNQEADGLNERLRSCSFRTLPYELPEAGSRSTFNILLGSCFYMPGDLDGMVGHTFDNLPESHRPHVKFLCGDQVYLDNPWYQTTLKWNWSYRQPGAFRKMLLDKYLATWTQSPDENSGFNRLLTVGANYFCSDDHEFWNNAPSFGGVGLANTFSPRRRSWWFEEARKLFRMFQSRSSLLGFNIGNLSVKVVDTRIDRDTSGIRFMLYENLQEVQAWLSALTGPGVLVLGQPLLKADAIQSRTDKILSGFDKDLADYGQYAELKKSIHSCPHSVVVLTGDVHFARVAYLSPDSNGVTKFVEVVSSPMCLVPGFFGRRKSNRYQAALPLDSEPINSEKPFGEKHRDHFATVRFSAVGNDAVRMKVTYWPILSSDQNVAPEPMRDYEFTLN